MINNRNEAILKRFGEHLKALRKVGKLSQHELALKAGISKNQIGNIERGEVNITLITAHHITQVLNISLSQLFNLEF